MLKSLDERLRDAPPEGLGDVGIRQAAEVSLRTLQLAFEREGLEFASFLRSGSGKIEYPTITDVLRETLTEMGHTGKHGQLVGDGAFTILRGVLYDSREDERQYLQRLSRTYALLFTLNTDPRLLEFFQGYRVRLGDVVAHRRDRHRAAHPPAHPRQQRPLHHAPRLPAELPDARAERADRP